MSESRPSVDDAPTFADLYNEAIAHIRRTRKWVREAEEMAPREAAAMLDVLAGAMETAREMLKQGGAKAAIDFLRSQEEDEEEP